MKHILPILLLFCFHNNIIASTFYLDPANGNLNNDGSINAPWSSLEEVINADYIVSNKYSPLPYDPATSNLVSKNITGFVNSGDTLILFDGMHGEIFLRNYINDEFITIIGEQGHSPIIEKVKLQACKNWRFENLKVSTEDYGYYLSAFEKLFFVESHGFQGPCSHIVINNSEIYSTTIPWTIADDWLNKAGDGLYLKGDSIIANNNLITNIDNGLTAFGDHITAENNQIINFSGDGMRVLGSHILFKSNLIKNCYDVDDNHDDGIQSYTTTGAVVDHNQILSNTIINTDDTARPLNGPLQGIGCFDGFYNNWLIANNVINVNHWHGITLLGANDCHIINNTVIDPTPDIEPGGSWIRIADHKDGTPSSNCIVANNVANKFVIDALDVNNIILDNYAQYEANFQDYQMFDFHLKPSSILVNTGDATYATLYDLENNSRFLDANPDVGAYEFSNSTSTVSVDVKNDILVFPNPFEDKIDIQTDLENLVIELYELNGKLLIRSQFNLVNHHLGDLRSGIYLMRFIDNNAHTVAVKKLVKK